MGLLALKAPPSMALMPRLVSAPVDWRPPQRHRRRCLVHRRRWLVALLIQPCSLLWPTLFWRILPT